MTAVLTFDQEAHIPNQVNIPVVIAALSKIQNRAEPQRVAIGAIHVEDLVMRVNVARRDYLAQRGYQRDASPKRVNDLASQLRQERVDLPTAILLNLRDFEAAIHLHLEDSQTILRLEEETLYIVDGQHRVEALYKLYENDPDRWGRVQLPFVCLLGGSEFEEMEEFHVVNSNAKSVSTSLAYDILKQRAANNPSLQQQLQETGKEWIIRAEEIVEELAKTPLWTGRVRFPRLPGASTTISNNGMASSLKPLLALGYFGRLSTENQVRILAAYWEGIRRIIPDPFLDPPAYSLQKALGVNALHQVLVTVIEYVRSKNWSLTDPEGFRETMEDTLLTLQGETAAGHMAFAADFWTSGANGAAGAFSSHSGHRVLVARINNNLPEAELT